jgi:hypothetical protein
MVLTVSLLRGMICRFADGGSSGFTHRRPCQPVLIPIISMSCGGACDTTTLMATFRPGTSPPPVRMPTRRLPAIMPPLSNEKSRIMPALVGERIIDSIARGRLFVKPETRVCFWKSMFPQNDNVLFAQSRNVLFQQCYTASFSEEAGWRKRTASCYGRES